MERWLLLLTVTSVASGGLPATSITEKDKSELDDTYLFTNSIKEGMDNGCISRYIGKGELKLFIYCSTPSSNKFRMTIDNSTNDVEITLNAQNGQFICSDVNLANAYFENYLVTNERGKVQLSVLAINNLKLPSESLACILNKFNAKGTRKLIFGNLMGELKIKHLRGLTNFVTTVIISHQENNNAPLSVFQVVSQAVEKATIEYASVDLTPNVNNIFPDLVFLKLYKGNIVTLSDYTFANVPNLETLDLTDNNIQYVETYAFNGLYELRVLHLGKNLISTLPEYFVFIDLKKLNILTLSENDLNDLTADVFNGLEDLEVLSINGNKVDLDLGNRPFRTLTSLKELYLKSSRIRLLPSNLFRYATAIEKLVLSDNLITDVPLVLFKHLNLKYLYLDNNDLNELPLAITNMKELKYLDLGYNSMEEVNSKGYNLNLTNLSTLNLAGNRIKTLQPDVFNFAPNLEELSLANNGITISESQNSYRATYDYIICQNNEEFGSEERRHSPFQNLRYLKRLKLEGNNISIICNDWRASDSLELLDLSNNSIGSLSSEDMRFRRAPIIDTRLLSKDMLKPAATIDLRHNKIKYFDPYVYSGNHDTPKFILNDNPFNCSCSFLPFIQKYINNHNILPHLDINEAKCAEPTDLEGKTLDELLKVPLEVMNELISNNCVN